MLSQMFKMASLYRRTVYRAWILGVKNLSWSHRDLESTYHILRDMTGITQADAWDLVREFDEDSY